MLILLHLTGHGTTNWFQIGKGVHQGCILSPCLFNLYAEYIVRNAGLEDAQAEIKIAGRNINNLRYADDTILTAILIPACASSSPAFLTMYSAYKLNKQSDNIQP